MSAQGAFAACEPCYTAVESLGGRLMVRLQTLDLRIGVRVPASQPLIRKDFRYGASRNLRSRYAE